MGLFDWLSYGISNGFYPQYTPGVNDSPHYAVDVPTPFHTPITALWSGTVQSQRTGLPWGTEIFIKPDNGGPVYYLYHLDQLYTTVGEHLNAGQVIGLSGGQNSGGLNPSSPQESSGVHTHIGFFTQFQTFSKPTGDVTIPTGPDITPYIQALAQSGTSGYPSGSSSSSSPASPWDALLQPLGTSLQQGAEVAMLVTVALLLGYFGFKLLTGLNVGNMTKAASSKVKDVAKVAAVA